MAQASGILHPMDPPQDRPPIEVTVEIPSGSRNKYEFDHARDRFVLDRTLYSSVHYPCDYGFIEDTLADDGDPLDVLVVIAEPTFPGLRRPRAAGRRARHGRREGPRLQDPGGRARRSALGVDERPRGPLAASAARDRELLPDLQDAREPPDRGERLARRRRRLAHHRCGARVGQLGGAESPGPGADQPAMARWRKAASIGARHLAVRGSIGSSHIRS